MEEVALHENIMCAFQAPGPHLGYNIEPCPRLPLLAWKGPMT
jgi:hypothetical protein